MSVTYRALEEADVGEAAELFITALCDMARRNGLSAPTAYSRAYVEPRFAQLRRTGIFRVAEVDGKIVSICCALVRGEQWFLSMFWTLPEWQRQGVGGPLLRQVWQEGRQQGARLDFTWSSVDFAAIGSYLRLGMLPGCQIFTFAGAPRTVPEPTAGYTLEPLARATAAQLDVQVRGTARDREHEFFQSSASAAHQVRVGGELAGYFYAGDGVIGPAAWTSSQHARPVLDLAVRAASEQARDIKLMTLGLNQDALRAALDLDLKIVSAAHFLRSQPFGALQRYLPSGPVFF